MASRGNPYTEHSLKQSFLATGAFDNENNLQLFEGVPGKLWYSRWTSICPVCSEDEFVDAGLCSGTFSSSAASLLLGSKPCRCANNYPWSEKQREYQISKALVGQSEYSFSGWVNGYKNAHSYMNIKCKDHGIFKVSVTNFLSRKSRCPKCMVCGFDIRQSGYIYVLKVEGISDNFTGYGITNNIVRRMYEHKFSLGREGLKITAKYFAEVSGQAAEKIEEGMKTTFPLYKNSIENFKTEATKICQFENAISFVKDQVSKHLS